MTLGIKPRKSFKGDVFLNSFTRQCARLCKSIQAPIAKQFDFLDGTTAGGRVHNIAAHTMKVWTAGPWPVPMLHTL